MSTDYRHTQPGTLILVSCGAAVLFILPLLFWFSHLPVMLLVVALSLVATLVAAIQFASLTIQIDQDNLTLTFALGFPRKSIPLQDIEAAQAVRNPWYYGWGMRLTPRGWLYNVSGLDAVEVTLKSGKRIRLGTDQPHMLLEAIQQRHV